ncbi:tRNA intron endonuclease [Wuchereria bancrofti]|uniref:tRNA-intron lyase n=1 Tax=Wuchereria bancrofti TaxID=6293 RepID=J9BEN9_WUCBA|nr:tRNA intron endonuclease [Wuchereria bancrofti]
MNEVTADKHAVMTSVTETCSASKDEKLDVSMKCVPVRIEYLNSQFLVFDVNVAEQIMRECRIIAEAYGTSPNARADLRKYGAPFILMPEQVAVVQLKSNTEDIPIGRSNVELSRPHSIRLDDEALRKKAEMMAKGRKAKKLKRQANSEATAATLKVRRCDIVNVEVTASEIDDAVKELSEHDNTHKQGDIWRKDEKFKLMEVGLQMVVENFDKKLEDPSLCNQNKSFTDDTREEAYEEMKGPPLPESSVFRIRLNTFRDLWRRGYYLTCGLKFGCDYLAYESTPGEDHSKWLVKCVDSQDTLSFLDLIALSRLSSQVKKHVLLAIVSPDTLSPYYIEYSWWKPQRSQNV